MSAAVFTRAKARSSSGGSNSNSVTREDGMNVKLSGPTRHGPRQTRLRPNSASRGIASAGSWFPVID
jgi:hypothetical protein